MRELVLDCVTKTMFRDLTTFRMGLFRAGEAYQYLEEAMEKIDKGVESIEDLYRVKRSAENAIDSFVGAGLAGTKGKVSLGRSIRRWWRGVGS